MFRFKKEFEIGSKKIGEGHPVYLVAEIGRNHNGDMELAKETIDAAVEAGADSVKFQSFKARDLLVKNLSDIKHVSETGKGKSLYQLTEEVELSKEQHRELGRYCREKEIDFFSTPLDPSFVPLLEEINVPLYKIASLDLRYFDLIARVAETKKPVFISTGMSY
ncbi:MAG: N-acetylneuraminate synthase family protein, partial [Nitrospinota bacterium]